ncbi:TPA: hypothetical protein ACKRHO_003340 [Morganella morganii]|uniref:hypothetical protein n=1 Tax=Morganella morganii TaxID=582 RepID=UPI000DF9E6C5|nr:hypothetical protein [Morganella morganii]MBT0360375.1 hypothetical protein [Morganella morganii subsp. morganii]MDU2632833.1 hypothetical protein [Morganella morganii]STZ16104.1 Uncharacterised protein [Morganella morganii]HCR3550864.1 hypothetical protein [Morganella morganii]HCT9739129.1 hypothetical protein [Morganella morganii]
MPISFKPIEEKDSWFGAAWSIEDEAKLASIIARVAIGQSRVAEKILKATSYSSVNYPKSGYDAARQLLIVKPGEKPYHRDGWVFQVISWVAAHKSYKNALIRAPQMIKADKGLDGFLIETDSKGISKAVIFEDKATENPRNKIKNSVLPEFKTFEKGERDNELIASVVSLLERSGCADPDIIVAEILWNEKRAYRIAITVDDTHSTKAGLRNLFKGYDVFVAGDWGKRRGDILHQNNFRNWIDTLSQKAIEIINMEESYSNV